MKGTPYTDELLGKIGKLVGTLNRVQRERIYTFEYYNGMWIWIRYRESTSGVFTDLVKRDTRATETNLTVALAAVRNELGRSMR